MTVVTHTYRFTRAGEDFGPRADGLVTAHTTESPYNRLTVADALVLAAWQDRDDVAGSYNDLICIDGVVSCVPPEHASGGINPGSRYFAPEPWLYDVMPAEQVRNPNFFTRNVSFMGQAAWFNANGWPPAMIDHFVRVMIEEEARIGSRVILTDHEDFQVNRSDAGPIANALIRQRYLELTGADMPALTNYALEIIQIDGNAAIRSGPSTSSPTLFMTGGPSGPIVRIGTIDTSEGQWSCYWLTKPRRWAYTLEQNVLSVTPLVSGVTEAEVAARVAEVAAVGERRVALIKEKVANLATSVASL